MTPTMCTIRPSHFPLGVAVLFGVLAAACAGTDTDVPDPNWGTELFQRDLALNVSNESSANLRRSHNTGENCVQCHQQYGPGRGLFTLAGSVADEEGGWLENPIVELWSDRPEEGGELTMRIEGDALGNFYTTVPLPMPEQRLFVTVLEANGNRVSSMPFAISNGSCNHCHAGGFAVTLREEHASLIE